MSRPKVIADPNKINWRLDEWFPDLPEKMRANLKLYHEELLKFNKTVNLIGAKTVQSADAVHFANSILAARVIEKDLRGDEVYDIGFGNGFPGLVFALLVPNKKIHFVEGDKKRAEFLKHMISILKLKNADVVAQSIEAVGFGSINCAIGRGVLPLSKSLLLARKAFAVNGVYYHLKGEEWAKELATLPTQLCSYWQLGLLSEYVVPGLASSEGRSAVIKTEKIQA